VAATVRRIYNVHTHTHRIFMNPMTMATTTKAVYDYQHGTCSDAALFVLLCDNNPYIVFEQTNDHCCTLPSVLNVVKSAHITHAVTMRVRCRISRRQIPASVGRCISVFAPV